jgi:ABC-type phosphate/phosphonate transport system permease subunit
VFEPGQLKLILNPVVGLQQIAGRLHLGFLDTLLMTSLWGHLPEKAEKKVWEKWDERGAGETGPITE